MRDPPSGSRRTDLPKKATDGALSDARADGTMWPTDRRSARPNTIDGCRGCLRFFRNATRACAVLRDRNKTAGKPVLHG